MWEVVFYQGSTGRNPVQDFLAGLPPRLRSHVYADLVAVGEHGARAPVSMKPIKGARGLWEIRTGGYRTFYCVVDGRMWVLHSCKKQDQERGITIAQDRMNEVRRG